MRPCLSGKPCARSLRVLLLALRARDVLWCNAALTMPPNATVVGVVCRPVPIPWCYQYGTLFGTLVIDSRGSRFGFS